MPFRFPATRLVGSNWRNRAFACFGALLGIGATGYLSAPFAPSAGLTVMAPLGASAVLLFAVPASPLAQPWSIIGGNTISAFVSVAICKLLPAAFLLHFPFAAIAIAVAGAIAGMSITRSLHPPGGAVALGVALSWQQIALLGFHYPFVPVLLNSAMIVAIGVLFHRVSGTAYPHRVPAPPAKSHGTRDAPPAARVGVQDRDIAAALADLHETFDIERGDLAALVRQVEANALEREYGGPTCADIMSRDIVSVTTDTSPVDALRLLLRHNVTALPVTDADHRIQGLIDLRGLALARESLGMMMTVAHTVRADMPAMKLVSIMTDGATHPVVVADRDGRLIGIVAPTDLLVALASIATANRVT